MRINVEDRELILKYKKRPKYLEELYYKIIENTMGMNLNEIHIK